MKIFGGDNIICESTLGDYVGLGCIKQVKRTGEIDLLRFVFSIVLAFFHFNGYYDLGIFTQASIWVEFFFLVSGYLMARHVDQLHDRPKTWGEVADCTWKYLLKRFGSFYRYYAMAVIINFVVRNIIIFRQSPVIILMQVLSSIPTFLLVFLGLNRDGMTMYVGGTWYLSAMVIAMFILYPLLLKQFRLSTKVIFPLMSIFLLGYLCNTYGQITRWFDWNGICYTGVLRAIAVIALGASLYQVTLLGKIYYNQWRYAETFVGKFFITTLKVMCYGVVLIYSYNGTLFGKNATLHALFFCAIGVALSFAEIGYSVCDNKFTRYLGKISLPVYIFHVFLHSTSKDLTGDAFISFKVSLLLFGISIFISVVLMYVTDFVFARAKLLFVKKGTK